MLLAGHLPPGVDTVKGGALWLPQYEQRFAATVLAYADVIVGQLYGYLHREHFSVMHSHEPSRVDEMGENGGEGLKWEKEGVEKWVYVREGPKDIQEDEEEEGEEDREMVAGQKGRRLQDIVSGISMPVNVPVEQDPGDAASSSSTTGSSKPQVPGRPMNAASWMASRKQRVGPGARRGAPSPRSAVGWLLGLRRGRGRRATGDPSGTASAILISPSLSPVLKNRPAFRAFKYDRSAVLQDYTEHTANLHVSQCGASARWAVRCLAD